MAAMLERLSKGWRTALVAAALTIGSVAVAQEFRADHPDTYVVKRGDTLWDIAGKFLRKPWLWPEIWQANPQIKNPHRIYPGDRLSLVYADGRPILTVNGQPAFGPRVREEPLDAAATAVPLGDVRAFLTKYRVYNAEDTKNLPYIVGLEENRLLAQSGNLAYVRGLSAQPGTKVVVLRAGNEYFDVPKNYPWNSDEREVVAEKWSTDRGATVGNWWKNVAINPMRRSKVVPLGREMIEIAHGTVTRSADVSSVELTYDDVEVKAGDLVVVGEELPFDLTFYPHPPAKAPDNMRVVALSNDMPYGGTKDVVALSRGRKDGIEVGQVYSVFRPGEVIRDRVKYPDNDARAAFRPGKANVTLPEEYVGTVMVFRTFDGISYGLMMDGIRPVKVYDVAHMPTE